MISGMARPASFDLEKELAKPGFTPGARDIDALVEIVRAGDEPAATRAAGALVGLAEKARTAVMAALRGDGRTGDAPGPGADEAAMARLIGVLGRMARAGDDDARGAVIGFVGHGAPRVRRAAVVALGKVGGDEARTALVARWDAGDATADERRALAEALGKVGGDEALARLRALQDGGDAELVRRRDRAVLMADRSARRDAASEIAADVGPPRPLVIQLAARQGLGGVLREELMACGYAVVASGERAEIVLEQPLRALFASRLWASAGMPVALGAGELAAEITRAIVSPEVRGVMRAWTRGPIRWRLGFAKGHRRAVVWRVARDVTKAAPELINDPTATTWDVIVDDDARGMLVVPRRLADPRFAYRVADVPAASHPTVAAALAWVAEARPDDRVWDPFCGSGVELVERARRGPARRLLGSDVDGDALAAARANLAAAGVAAELVVADARSHAPGPIDLIVTNPPLGSRVRLDAAALLVAALPGFARTLAPRGRLVWITPAPRKTSPVAEGLGLVRRQTMAVDLGGVRGQLERWDRR
jgi:Putative RNA methylase family UPF0020/HEAT repeats